jgi:hypothetical protein
MVEKEEHSQLELFSQERGSTQLRSKKQFSGSLLGYIANYEKIILLIIGFIITGVVSFCLGVEKGKSAAGPRLNLQFDMAQEPVLKTPPAKKTQNENSSLPVNSETQTGLIARAGQNSAFKKQIIQPVAQQAQGGYTIQVASFQARDYAQRETEKLKKEGFYALILSKGSYSVVCVGNFADKATAQPSLSKLKQSYRDCYLRRL